MKALANMRRLVRSLIGLLTGRRPRQDRKERPAFRAPVGPRPADQVSPAPAVPDVVAASAPSAAMETIRGDASHPASTETLAAIETSLVGETPTKRHSAPAGLVPEAHGLEHEESQPGTALPDATLSPGATKDQPIPVPEATEPASISGAGLAIESETLGEVLQMTGLSSPCGLRRPRLSRLRRRRPSMERAASRLTPAQNTSRAPKMTQRRRSRTGIHRAWMRSVSTSRLSQKRLKLRRSRLRRPWPPRPSMVPTTSLLTPARARARLRRVRTIGRRFTERHSDRHRRRA